MKRITGNGTEDMDIDVRTMIDNLRHRGITREIPECGICHRTYCICENVAILKKLSRIDAYFKDNDFKVHDKELLPYYNSLDWIGKNNLFIFGNYGCHKTGQVTAILKKALSQGNSCRYYRASEIVYQKDIEKIKNVSILVLDNFGKDVTFEDSRNCMFDLIDYRLHNSKSTIIITNELLEGKIDGALWDRIKMFDSIKITGDSQRGVK